MTDNSLIDYVEEMRDRYPGLSKRRMCIMAGVPDNLIYKIKEGLTPRPATLEKLAFKGAQEKTQTEEQKWGDYHELLRRAGYEVPGLPEDAISDEERQWLKRWRRLSPEQRELANSFFRAYNAGDTLDVLGRGLMQSDTSSRVAEAFTQFLHLLAELAELSPEERTWLVADALRRFRSKGTPNGNPDDSVE